MVLVIAPKPNGNACYALYKGPLLASNLNHQLSGDFPPFSPLHSFLDISGSTVPDQFSSSDPNHLVKARSMDFTI